MVVYIVKKRDEIDSGVFQIQDVGMSRIKLREDSMHQEEAAGFQHDDSDEKGAPKVRIVAPMESRKSYTPE